MTSLESRLAEIEARRRQAHEHICDLASGKRQWNMCIPIHAKDSDMVLQAPLDDLAWALDTIRAMWPVVEATDAFIDHTQKRSKITGENKMQAPEEYVEMLRALVAMREKLGVE